jgi:hypothetical protein
MGTPKSKAGPAPKAKARDAKAPPKAAAAKPTGKAPAKGRKGSK